MGEAAFGHLLSLLEFIFLRRSDIILDPPRTHRRLEMGESVRIEKHRCTANTGEEHRLVIPAVIARNDDALIFLVATYRAGETWDPVRLHVTARKNQFRSIQSLYRKLSPYSIFT